MNIRAENYDDKVSGEEKSAVVLCTVRLVTATCLAAWCPTAAMWRAYERYCHRETLMMAINNNIAMSYLFICRFFSLLPSLKDGVEGDKEKEGGEAE